MASLKAEVADSGKRRRGRGKVQTKILEKKKAGRQGGEKEEDDDVMLVGER